MPRSYKTINKSEIVKLSELETGLNSASLKLSNANKNSTFLSLRLFTANKKKSSQNYQRIKYFEHPWRALFCLNSRLPVFALRFP